MAISPQEFCNFFHFDQTAPRVVGYATRPALVRDEGVAAVSACFQLLSRTDKRATDKWLWLQLQPPDAIALAASILAQAKDQKWVVQPDFWELVERFRLPKKSESN